MMSEFAIVDLGSVQYCCKGIVLKLDKRCLHKVEGKAIPLRHTCTCVPPKTSVILMKFTYCSSCDTMYCW